MYLFEGLGIQNLYTKTTHSKINWQDGLWFLKLIEKTKTYLTEFRIWKRTHTLMCIRTKLYHNYDLIFSFVLGIVVGKYTFKLCNLHHSFPQSDISVIGNDYKLIWIVLLNWRYLTFDWDVFFMYVLLSYLLILNVKYVLVLFKPCEY